MLTRRSLLAGATAGLVLRAGGPKPIFDGKSLAGWIDVENSAYSISPRDLTDPASLAAKLHVDFTDAAALSKELNRRIGGDRAVRSKLQQTYPEHIAKAPERGWIVKDRAMSSNGAGRGVLYTAQDYTKFRLGFTVRHVSGNPDHEACVLIFCTRPLESGSPLDALAGIQFQPPNGGHWDYRPGKNNNGNAFFNRVLNPGFDPHEWSRVEIVADAGTGTASMSVAQPVGAKPVEVLTFHDPTAGKTGPIAWQMHNPGLFDEYKEVTIETNPA